MDQFIRRPLVSLSQTWKGRHWVVLGGVALTLFFVWVAWPSADRAEPVPSPPERAVRETGQIDPAEFLTLRAELRKEIEARERLERDVGLLQALIETHNAETAGLELATNAQSEDDETAETQTGRVARRRAFDRDALLAGGVDPDEAESLRAAWEDLQMEKIYLNDQATREGWAGTARHRQELRELDASPRDDLSPESYDRYLYAAGRHNRARIVDVIDRSNGAAAGFVVGDSILSYDGQRVFNPDDLRKLASSGRTGEVVRVEVARGTSTTIIDIPRGPIGLMLMPDRQPPN